MTVPIFPYDAVSSPRTVPAIAADAAVGNVKLYSPIDRTIAKSAPSKKRFTAAWLVQDSEVIMDGKVLKQAKGLNGTLELLEDRIRIRRDGWTSRLYGSRHHEEELYLSLIHTIELKKMAGGLAGYIAFNGGTDPDCLEDLCVSYLLPQEHNFDEMRAAIEEQRDRYIGSPQYANSQLFTVHS